MSMRATIRQAASAAFSAAGDIKLLADYWRQDEGLNDYDAARGQRAVHWDVVQNIPVLFVQASQSRLISDVDWLVKPGDRVALIDQRYLAESNVGDVMAAAGHRWRVENVKADPAAAIWKLQIRLTSYEPVQGTGTNRAITG